MWALGCKNTILCCFRKEPSGSRVPRVKPERSIFTNIFRASDHIVNMKKKARPGKE